MRFAFCLLLMAVCCPAIYAQQLPPDPTTIQSVLTPHPPQQHLSVLDSVVLATKAHEKFMLDSLSIRFIKAPDSAMQREYVQRMLHDSLFTGTNFLAAAKNKKSNVREGHHRETLDQWVIVLIIGLLLYTGLLNIVLNKDVKNVLRSFYSKRIVLQAGKDEGYINFWSFVGLFLLFGVTFGLFLYQWSVYRSIYYSVS